MRTATTEEAKKMIIINYCQSLGFDGSFDTSDTIMCHSGQTSYNEVWVEFDIYDVETAKIQLCKVEFIRHGMVWHHWTGDNVAEAKHEISRALADANDWDDDDAQCEEMLFD